MPGEPAIIDFIFAGAERTGKTTLKAEIQKVTEKIQQTVPPLSPAPKFKFFELSCDIALAQVVLQEMASHLPTAHLIYTFVLTDLSSPVSLEKLPAILDSITPIVESVGNHDTKKWFLLMNKYDLPEAERPLKMVDFVDLISTHPVLKVSPHLKTSLLPSPTNGRKQGLEHIAPQVQQEILMFARILSSQKSIPTIEQHNDNILELGGAGAGAPGVIQNDVETMANQLEPLAEISNVQLMK